MKKNKILTVLMTSAILIPAVSFAEPLGGVKKLLVAFKDLLNSIIPVVIGLAVIFFFWGVGQFVLKDAGNEKAREEGKQKMLWGVIALFIMFSIFGLLNWIGTTLDIPTSIKSDSSGADYSKLNGQF